MVRYQLPAVQTVWRLVPNARSAYDGRARGQMDGGEREDGREDLVHRFEVEEANNLVSGLQH